MFSPPFRPRSPPNTFYLLTKELNKLCPDSLLFLHGKLSRILKYKVGPLSCKIVFPTLLNFSCSCFKIHFKSLWKKKHWFVFLEIESSWKLCMVLKFLLSEC